VDAVNGIPIEILDCTTHSRPWPKTTAELDEIVATYDPALLKAPVKFDHQTAGGPAQGWVERVERQGTKLVAWLGDVSEELKQAVSAGRYRNRSVELYVPGNNEPAFKGKPYLRALAFLGADVPASKGLAPIANFVEIVSPGVAWLDESSDAGDNAEKGRDEMDPKLLEMAETALKESKNQVATLSEKVQTLTEENTTLKGQVQTLSEQVAAAAKAEETRVKAERQARDEARFAELLKDGRALPAEKERIVAMLASLSEEGAVSLFEVLKSRPKAIETGVRDAQPVTFGTDAEKQKMAEMGAAIAIVTGKKA